MKTEAGMSGCACTIATGEDDFHAEPLELCAAHRRWQREAAEKATSYLTQENSVLHERVRKLENDNQDLERMLAVERQEKWQLERKAKERWALRRELEEAVGLADRETYDEEKFKAAVKRISGLKIALEKEREACAKLAEEYGIARDNREKETNTLKETALGAAKAISTLIRGREEG